VLRVEALSFSYGRRPLLEGLCLEARPGESLAVVGANGSGKTTLLSLLAGVLRPDAGRVSLDGQVRDPGSPEWKALVGFVPDDNALVPGLTFAEHVRLCASLHDLGEAESRRRGAELLDLFGLAESSGDCVEYGSQGMQKRLACALALVASPRLLLLDEPFNGLDAANVFLLVDVMRECAGRALAVIFSTHGLDLAALAADRYVELAGGRADSGGPASDLASSRPEVRAHLGEAFRWIRGR
jgi:ABC-2 type transport system ATP-binding protein